MVRRVEGAVTTNLSVHFLCRRRAADVLAEARILRIGRCLAVGEVVMHISGDPRLVRHASCTYAIQPAHGSL